MAQRKICFEHVVLRILYCVNPASEIVITSYSIHYTKLYDVGTWQVLTGSGNVNDPMNPKSSLTGLSKGENVLRWLVQKGKCSLYDEVTITNDLPSVPYAGADETICENFVKLKATQSIHGQGSWSIVITSYSIHYTKLYDLPAIVVNEPGQPLSMVVTEIGSGPCAGSNNGEIRVTGQGGISPYDIEIYNASNGLIASATDVDALTQSSLNPGVYRVELTDANNVTVSNTDVRISEPSSYNFV